MEVKQEFVEDEEALELARGFGEENKKNKFNDFDNRKLFVSNLSASTTEKSLKNHFAKYGELVDVAINRLPFSKKSRCRGVITFQTEAQAEACFAAKSHIIDGKWVFLNWNVKKENEFGKAGAKESKVFVGGLNYSTTTEDLKAYFSKFGTIVDAFVPQFYLKKRSRGFGFVTFASSEMVDACQAARPHRVDGFQVETRRASPKGEEVSPKVRRAFIGALKDVHTDEEELRAYFSQFGEVVKVEQIVHKATGRKRGFGFVEFNDYDPVDKLMLKSEHVVHGQKIEVEKAVSKDAMKRIKGNRRNGGRHEGDAPSTGGKRQSSGPLAPWNSSTTFQNNPCQSHRNCAAFDPMKNHFSFSVSVDGPGGSVGPVWNNMIWNRPAPYPLRRQVENGENFKNTKAQQLSKVSLVIQAEYF